ncbi:bifunctional 4-hydroxy-2-oxoglutarate aldolase/2-dehydro-3-deoxy-phosphogluconate aldolase [Diaminobutyricibacter sp. McL0618]|uniref:bifunctional 4-hydroxy-2-oxoglutarate aldolase/2-dehydro-3-deoxy-phosphogluconate aldolase n=1 Tax=Leifsonia sp. McL0618 TaxID=3415677 RepID=UPI003CE8D68B
MNRPSPGPLAEALAGAPILGIVRTDEPGVSDLVVDALVQGGIRAVEISLTSLDALGGLVRALDKIGDGALVGIGTVRTGNDADQAIAGGARFLVSPNLSGDVLSIAHDAGVPVVCGVLTPTEIQRAIDLGAEWLKIFPAASFGPDYIAHLSAPFPDVAFVPTGGIRVSDVAAYRSAGAAAVGLAGSLARSEQVKARQWSAISSTARAALEAWAGGDSE